MNRAERRALAKQQRHRGRVTGDDRPRATVQHIDPDGVVVKTETVFADQVDAAQKMVDDANTARQNTEAYEREMTRARMSSVGFWIPE